MASFVVDLWESIFVPGPTPVLLQAANATFAALQLLLFILLCSTYSIHFVVLSVLSGGLWWSINWFAAELAAAKARGDFDGKKEYVKPDQEEDGEETEVEDVGKKPKQTTGADADASTSTVTKRKGGKAAKAEASGVSTEDEWEKVSNNE
ncbi:hypothetical protein VHEMI04006 [[Torrubiella] hemipterigena]|uniref:Endoplasmic reticulum, protein Pkr1 n=1 Tax=[Torrubiella] hemipterigena TaxID=1531966 RepID=A0A0A1T035_9HYPO|nr:hypothetical protein VHEMI04006 [[Torrubiella] hemipterigena]